MKACAIRKTAVATMAALLPMSASGTNDCRLGSEMQTIESRHDAACYLLYVAEELLANAEWCMALTGDRIGWQVALDLWARRNGEYLDNAVSEVTGGEESSFSWESPLLDDREPALEVGEAQCRHDLRHANEGEFDVDLVPLLRPLKRYLG